MLVSEMKNLVGLRLAGNFFENYDSEVLLSGPVR